MGSDQIVEILARADLELEATAAQAIRSGDLSTVRRARAVAGALVKIRQKLLDASAVPEPPVPINRGVKAPVLPQRPVARPVVSQAGNYPRFEIQGGALVRIGYSRRHDQEYRREVPRRIFECLVLALKTLVARSGGPFVVEQIVGEVKVQSRDTVHRRSIFLGLGMLQEQGTIRQDHTGAYQIPGDIGAVALRGFRDVG